MYCIPPHSLSSLLFHYLLYSPAPSRTRLTYCLPSLTQLLACFLSYLVPLYLTYMPALPHSLIRLLLPHTLTSLLLPHTLTRLLWPSLTYSPAPFLTHIPRCSITYLPASYLSHLLACFLPHSHSPLLNHLLACFFSLSLTLLLPSSVVYPPASSKLN